MNLPYRYIQVEENGRVVTFCETPVEGVTIDTNGIELPEMPTDAYYVLYYDSKTGFKWVKQIDKEPPLTEQEQTAIDTALNVEYMACLLETSLT